MDSLDYIFNFSSELLVIIFVLMVAGFNIFYFFGRTEYNYDQSLAAKFLSYHVSLNKQLYAKSNSIKTVVIKPSNGLIAAASADDTFLQNNTDETDSTNQDNTVLDNALVRPNPDSIKGLIAKQVQIYETESGDTLPGIAKKFNITTQTLKWANNLPSNTIKPGWFLLVPPTDGVIVQIKNTNTTLPDLAKKYHANLDNIISYNGLENAEDIPDVGQYLIIKDGRIDPPPAPKKKKGGVTYLPNDNVGADHTFPAGYCTYYVARKVWVPWGGNAKNWPVNARAMGRAVDKNPVKGGIAVTAESRWGHVAYIEKVNGDGTITVSEMNATAGFGKIDTRVLPMSAVRSIIHP